MNSQIKVIIWANLDLIQPGLRQCMWNLFLRIWLRYSALFCAIMLSSVCKMCSYLCEYSWGHHKDTTHASWIESRHLWRENRLHLTTGLQCFSHSDSVHWVTANLKERVSCVTCSRHVENQRAQPHKPQPPLLPSPVSTLFHQLNDVKKEK